MKILDTKILHSNPHVSLASSSVEHNGKSFDYIYAFRGVLQPHSLKLPDAVVIVAMTMEEVPRLVLTHEFRVPIACRELSFPAGLIDKADLSRINPACSAACRELKEETGFDLSVTEVSPPNLYSSAGLTNESVTFVFGRAIGQPSTLGNEDGEDIEIKLVTLAELIDLMDNESYQFSKNAWPLLWAMKRAGSFLI
jgi:ADP-ribose pyrophosphatase